MNTSSIKSSFCLLLFLLVRLGITAQDQPSLETLLARLPMVPESSEIKAPEVLETKIKSAFIQQDEALEEALSLLYQIFSQEPESAADEAALLLKISTDVWMTLAQASQADSLQLAQLKIDLTKVRQTNSSDESVGFAQAQTKIAALTARYLMQYFYTHPMATQSTVWRNYLQGKATAANTPTLDQVAAVPENNWQRLQNRVNLLLGLSLGLLAGLVYLFFTKVSKKQYGSGPDFYTKDFEKNILPLQERMQALSTQQKALAEQLKEHNSAAIALPTSATSQLDQVEIKETSPPREESASINRTFYTVAPKNGVFFVRQLVANFKPREHIYRIEVLDEDHAYYYLVEDTATRQHAFNIPDSYILPAMELEGTGRLAEASQIEVQRGTLKRAGNNWQIEEKAVLNYSI